MTVTMHTPTRVGPNAWRLRWESDVGGTPIYRVYRNGRCIQTGPRNCCTVSMQADESGTIEVLDDADAVPAAIPRVRMRLLWDAVTGTARYRVQRYVGAAWVTEVEIRAGDRTNYEYLTPPLEDVTDHQYRVVPIGENGNEGTPATVTVTMVRNPDPPVVTMEYASGTGLVTIAAA